MSRLLAGIALGTMLFGCVHNTSSSSHCVPLQSKEPIPSRRHYIGSSASLDSARIVADLQSADAPSGHVRQGVVQLRPAQEWNTTYTMVEDTVVAGRYWHRLIAPGSYIVQVRRVGYSMLTDTVTLRAGTTDSAVYRIPMSGVCLSDF